MLHPALKFQQTSTIVACALVALRMPMRPWSGGLAPLTLGWRLSHLTLLRSCPSMSRSTDCGNLVFVVYFQNSAKQSYISVSCERSLSISVLTRSGMKFWKSPMSRLSSAQMPSRSWMKLPLSGVGKSVSKIISQSTSIFQHQRAGFWCDHLMPFVLCQSNWEYFHHLKGGSSMFFHAFSWLLWRVIHFFDFHLQKKAETNQQKITWTFHPRVSWRS